MRFTSPYDFSVIEVEAPVKLGHNYIVESRHGMFIASVSGTSTKLEDLTEEAQAAVKSAVRDHTFRLSFMEACNACDIDKAVPSKHAADAYAEVAMDHGEAVVNAAVEEAVAVYPVPAVMAAFARLRPLTVPAITNAPSLTRVPATEVVTPPPVPRIALNRSPSSVPKEERIAELEQMPAAALLQEALAVTANTMIDLSAAPPAVLRRAVLEAEYPTRPGA